jgi:hypothetical protein
MQDVHAVAGEGAQLGGEVFGLAGEDEDSGELTEPSDEDDLHLHEEDMESFPAAVTNGMWNVSISEGSVRNSLFFYAFKTISAFEEGAQDGSLRNALTAFLCQAAAAEAGEATARAAVAEASPVVVGTWGAKLQLSLQFPPVDPLVQRPHGVTGGTSSGFGMLHSSNLSSNSRMAARAVVVKGQSTVFDQEVLLEQDGSSSDSFHLELLVPPGGHVLGTSKAASSELATEGGAVAALYLLPSLTPPEQVAGAGAGRRSSTSQVGLSNGAMISSSNNSSTESSNRDAAASNPGHMASSVRSQSLAGVLPLAPLAHLTLLLLPPAQAQELLHWVQTEQLTHQQLQPLLEDMAVAVEAAEAAAAGGVAGLGAQRALLPAVLERAAAAAEQVVCCFDMYGLMLNRWGLCVCLQQLKLAMKQLQVLVAVEGSVGAVLGGAGENLGHPASISGAAAAVTSSSAAAATLAVTSAATEVPAAVGETGAAATSTATAQEQAAAGAPAPEVQAAGTSASTVLGKAQGKLPQGKEGKLLDPGFSSTAAGSGMHQPAEEAGAAGVAAAGLEEGASCLGKIAEGSTGYEAADEIFCKGKKGQHTEAAVAAVANGSTRGDSFPAAAAIVQPSVAVQAAAAVQARSWAMLWWWCIWGSLVGWGEKHLEERYQSARLQHYQQEQGLRPGVLKSLLRPMTWLAMAAIFICLDTLAIVRVVRKILEGVYSGAVLATAWYVIFFVGLPEVCYGVWLLRCPLSWLVVGRGLLYYHILRFVAFLGQGFIGYSACEQIMRGGLNERLSYTFYCVLFATIDTLLHQLPPPWLLPNAVVLGVFMVVEWYCMPGLWDYGVLGQVMAPWVLAVSLTALGVAGVVVQESAARHKYVVAQAAAAAAGMMPVSKKGAVAQMKTKVV